VTTHDNLPVAAAASVDGDRWLAHLDDLMDRIAVRLSRIEPRRRARQLVLGLLSDLPRKNCWTIAEHVGDRSPDGLQHLLAEARWITTASAMTCANMSWLVSATRTLCWWSTRQGI
jgi:hypothetical protein